jgi:hypothetical protein
MKSFRPVRLIVRSTDSVYHVRLSFSVDLSARFSAASTGQISVTFCVGDFYYNLSGYSKLSQNPTKIWDILHED